MIHYTVNSITPKTFAILANGHHIAFGETTDPVAFDRAKRLCQIANGAELLASTIGTANDTVLKLAEYIETAKATLSPKQ